MDKEILECGMQKLQKGDMSALDDIYNITSKTVYYLAYSILKNSELAKDIMQETFIRIVANIDKYNPNTNASAWISCIARNLSLRQIKNLKRNVSLELFIETDIFDYSEQWIDNLLLKKAMDILSIDERQIVMLFSIENFKHREIAQIVNKPVGTVKWIYAKAIKKLKNIY